MFLAIKEILKEKKRYTLIIAIIILIAYLVFFLLGLSYGLAKDNTTEIERWNAESLVFSEGSNKSILVSRIDPAIKDDYSDQEASLINVMRAVAYINGIEDEDHTDNIVIIGTPDTSRVYPQILEGRKPENSAEIVADLNIKTLHEMELGDTLTLASNGQEFTIVGFSEAVKYQVSPVIYTDLVTSSPQSINADEVPETIDYAKDPQPISQQVSAMILHNGTEVEDTKEIDQVSVEDFIQAVPGYQAQNITFAMMIAFLIVITAIVLGVFMYIITNQKRQTFAIMKIQGISNGFIGKSVVIQTLLVTLVGLVIGLGLTYGTGAILPPAVPFRSELVFYLAIAGLILVFSLLGAIFSVVSVAKVDPLEVLE